MTKICIVEDDENIRGIVSYALRSADYEPVEYDNGEEFLSKVVQDSPSLVVLDIMLPGEDGLTVLKKLRNASATKNVPVIMLTAKGSEIDKVTGLDMGADDYIAKPFGVMELLSRINAVLRRGKPEESPLLVYENISIDTARRTVTVDGERISLTFKEYELLRFLASKQGLAQARSSILSAVWDSDFEGESRTLDIHIRTLRKKLGPAARNHIKTIRNVGYKLGD